MVKRNMLIFFHYSYCLMYAAVIAANHHLLNECQAKYLVISFKDDALDYE